MARPITLSLDQLPHRRPAIVAFVDWGALSLPEQRRLRNLGLDEGVAIEALHSGPGATRSPSGSAG